MNTVAVVALAVVFAALGGCGTTVPLKDPLHENTRDNLARSRQGLLEANLVGNIRCEIQHAVYDADRLGSLPYLGTTWGTQVTLKLAWDEVSGLSPGASFIEPLVTMQSFTFGAGATLSGHATRVETVTFLYENRQLLAAAKLNARNGVEEDCRRREDGIMLDSDLRIGEFIYDKATLASTRLATSVGPATPQFSTFQEDITFVGVLGGNVTPTWRFVRASANTAGTFASATRTTTGDVLVTLGPLARDRDGGLLPMLGQPSASQHDAGIIGGSVASQVASQGRT